MRGLSDLHAAILPPACSIPVRLEMRKLYLTILIVNLFITFVPCLAAVKKITDCPTGSTPEAPLCFDDEGVETCLICVEHEVIVPDPPPPRQPTTSTVRGPLAPPPPPPPSGSLQLPPIPSISSNRNNPNCQACRNGCVNRREACKSAQCGGNGGRNNGPGACIGVRNYQSFVSGLRQCEIIEADCWNACGNCP
jgi:hypothetical protein